MNRKLMTLALASAFIGSLAMAANVTKVEARQRWPWNGKVDIVYNLVQDDPTNNPLPVFDVQFKAMNGTTPVTVTTVTGDGADGTVYGAGQKILTWDSMTDFGTYTTTNMTCGVYAKDVTSTVNYLKVNLHWRCHQRIRWTHWH